MQTHPLLELFQQKMQFWRWFTANVDVMWECMWIDKTEIFARSLTPPPPPPPHNSIYHCSSFSVITFFHTGMALQFDFDSTTNIRYEEDNKKTIVSRHTRIANIWEALTRVPPPSSLSSQRSWIWREQYDDREATRARKSFHFIASFHPNWILKTTNRMREILWLCFSSFHA
jgi:hypothetical protein